MDINILEEPAVSIFRAEGYGRRVPMLQMNMLPLSSMQKYLLYPEVGGSTFLQNITMIYQTTWHHSPEDNDVHHRLTSKIQNPHIFCTIMHNFKKKLLSGESISNEINH
jgi:hypothetical protein